jgi:hypothetical protein
VLGRQAQRQGWKLPAQAQQARPQPGQCLFFGRSLTAWLVAAPLALLLRALLREQAAIIAIFMVVTIGLGGAFLLSWRGLFFLTWRRLRRSRRS